VEWWGGEGCWGGVVDVRCGRGRASAQRLLWCWIGSSVGWRHGSCGVAPVNGCGAVVCVSFFFSSRRRHTRLVSDWSSDVCSSDLVHAQPDTFLKLRGTVALMYYLANDTPQRRALLKALGFAPGAVSGRCLRT